MNAAEFIPALVASWTLYGIAAGGLVVAVLVELLGGEDDQRLVQPARRLAFPLVLLGLLVDLAQRDLAGFRVTNELGTSGPTQLLNELRGLGVSWDIALLAILSALALLRGAPREGVARGKLARGVRGVLDALTLAGAWVVASGLVSLSDSPWSGPLWLGNACSMAVAGLILARSTRKGWPREAVGRLEAIDRGALALQGVGLLGLLLMEQMSLEEWGVWPRSMVPAFVVPVGWVLPGLVRYLAGARGSVVAAVLSLVGGIGLRFALLATG